MVANSSTKLAVEAGTRLTSICRLAPYERRVVELLRNSKDKRARKLAKKRVCITSFDISGLRYDMPYALDFDH